MSKAKVKNTIIAPENKPLFVLGDKTNKLLFTGGAPTNNLLQSKHELCISESELLRYLSCPVLGKLAEDLLQNVKILFE